MAFEVASVKPNRSDSQPSTNMPLGPGDVYAPTWGFFSATNFPLTTYIFFAYKVKGNETLYLLSELPGWVKTDRFDIQARATGNPTKDEMRLLMRSLLADRFQMTVHYETRRVPVLAFVLSKAGKSGPHLQPHADDPPCPAASPSPASADRPRQFVAGGFPAPGGTMFGIPPSLPGRLRVGGRNVTIGFIADWLSASAGLGRPMVDQTGLSGTFDFTLEWTVEPGADAAPEGSELTFAEALQEQLGIKLQSQKGPVEVLVVDHVEHPSEN